MWVRQNVCVSASSEPPAAPGNQAGKPSPWPWPCYSGQITEGPALLQDSPVLITPQMQTLGLKETQMKSQGERSQPFMPGAPAGVFFGLEWPRHLTETVTTGPHSGRVLQRHGTGAAGPTLA